MRISAFFFLFLFIGLLFQTQACPGPILDEPGPEPIADAGPLPRCFTPSTGDPVIEDFSYVDQVPGSPRVLRFRIKWSDSTGNLAKGTYQFIVDGTPQAKRELPDAVKAGERSGNVNLSIDLGTQALKNKQQIHLELQLWDADGNASNKPLLVLEATL